MLLVYFWFHADSEWLKLLICLLCSLFLLITRQNIRGLRVSVGLFSSTQPNQPNNWPNPSQPTARWTYGPMTQPNPTKPVYNRTPIHRTTMACRKKISSCISCHHHHPNALRNNANTHSITSITVTLGLHANPQRISSTDSTFSADSLNLLSVLVWPAQEKSRPVRAPGL